VTGRFAGERALVVGAGVAGVAAAEALLAEGAEVRVTDVRPADRLADAARLQSLGAEMRAGGHDPSDLEGATLVVVSPGVPPSAEVVVWARDRDLPVWGEMELGAHLTDAPYLAVTGTNGKTTTTGMLAACLRAGGLDAVACGNIGLSFPTAARGGHDALVVEVSSFQLALQESFHPKVSVLLNVAPDHLDWHGTFDAYVDAKARIHANQGEGDTHVGNRDDPLASRISAAAPCRVVWFRGGPPGEGEIGYVGDELVAPETSTPLGPVDGTRAGYRQDAAAAAAAALSFGVAPEAVFDDAGAAIARMLDAGRVALAADTLGACESMLAQAVAYAQQRKQFDRLIGSFQAVKHLCAEMVAELEPARSLLWYAAHALDALPAEAPLVASHALAHVSEIGREIASVATQVHGGIGWTDEQNLHFWFKRIGAARHLLGGPEQLRERAARLQGLVAA